MASTSRLGPADLPHLRTPMTTSSARSRRSKPPSKCWPPKAHCDPGGCAAHSHSLCSAVVCLARRVHHIPGSRLPLGGGACYANGLGTFADSVCLGIYGFLHCIRCLRNTHGVAGRPLGTASDADPNRRLLVPVYDPDRSGSHSQYAARDALYIWSGGGGRVSDALPRARPVVPAR